MSRTVRTIREVRAFTTRGGGADYHDQSAGHWIDDHIATPMSAYPDTGSPGRSFGIDVLGTAGRRDRGRRRDNRIRDHHRRRDRRLHHREASGAVPGRLAGHRDREDVGPDVQVDHLLWPPRRRPERHQRRRPGALRPARQDRGRSRCIALLGGPVRDELIFYATGARPDLAKEMGFIGGKMPLHHGPAEGEEGLARTSRPSPTCANASATDFWLMLDCWMSLDLDYATRLAHGAARYGLKWIEEALASR